MRFDMSQKEKGCQSNQRKAHFDIQNTVALSLFFVSGSSRVNYHSSDFKKI